MEAALARAVAALVVAFEAASAAHLVTLAEAVLVEYFVEADSLAGRCALLKTLEIMLEMNSLSPSYDCCPP